MRVPDAALDEVRSRGFALVEDFLSPDELKAAQEGLWSVFPRPEDYFADPDAKEHRWLRRGQFAGLRLFPYPAHDLNRLAHHPDLVDAAERFLGSTDLDLYKVEVWGKYAGAVDYDQPHHRDFGNHSLVVPRADGAYRQFTTFILLSDVTEQDGPTYVVPLEHTRDIPWVPPEREPTFPNSVPFGELFDVEVPATGRAGSLFMYFTEVFHRGSNFTEPGRSRFALLTDFQVRGHPWMGKMAWPNHALHPAWTELMVRATPRERDLFGFPPAGDPYWTDETLAGVAARYPGIDLSPYT